ncbi:MAG: hypothetical protein PHH07_05955, partial [Candidatus Cloacimonetes bacterium]|nr:hypothetical protein [Candidatus Cloacimonadota bacterium]
MAALIRRSPHRLFPWSLASSEHSEHGRQDVLLRRCLFPARRQPSASLFSLSLYRRFSERRHFFICEICVCLFFSSLTHSIFSMMRLPKTSRSRRGDCLGADQGAFLRALTCPSINVRMRKMGLGER